MQFLDARPNEKRSPEEPRFRLTFEASTGSTGGDAERVEFNSPFRRGPRYEKHFLVADLVTASRTRRLDMRNRRIEELLPGRPIYL